MKKAFPALLFLVVNQCFGATGSASDGELLILLIVLLLLMPLAVKYLIDFVKVIIHDCITGRRIRKHDLS